MNPLLTLQDMVDRTQQILQQATSQPTSSPLSTALIYAGLMDAYNELTLKGAELGRQELTYWLNTSLQTNGNGALELRNNGFRGKLVGLFRRQGVNIDYPTREEQSAVNLRLKDGFNSHWQNDTWREESDGTIRILNTTYANWRAWFLRVKYPLHSGTAEAGTTTSITFPASPTIGELTPITNCCVNDYVYINSGPAVGETGIITAYNATTRVATCASVSSQTGNAFSTAPTTSSTYSIVGWIPIQFNLLMCRMAASYFTDFDQSEHVLEFINGREKIMERFYKWMGGEDQVSPRYVIRRDWQTLGGSQYGSGGIWNLAAGGSSGS